MNSRKYLITGGWGKLGTHMRELVRNVSPRSSEMDILNTGQIESVMKAHDFDAVLHLAAISDQKLAERERAVSYRVNVIGTRNVAEMAEKYGLKIFYTSTDYVFQCDEGDYTEDDRPYPANWYGFTKYAGELEIQNSTDNYCIIRTSFRPSVWDFPTAYTNVYTSADYVDIIAQELSLCLKYDLSGIIHIGTQVKTLYELAKVRNPDILPEECNDESFPKRRNFNLDKWLSEKRKREKQ